MSVDEGASFVRVARNCTEPVFVQAMLLSHGELGPGLPPQCVTSREDLVAKYAREANRHFTSAAAIMDLAERDSDVADWGSVAPLLRASLLAYSKTLLLVLDPTDGRGRRMAISAVRADLEQALQLPKQKATKDLFDQPIEDDPVLTGIKNELAALVPLAPKIPDWQIVDEIGGLVVVPPAEAGTLPTVYKMLAAMSHGDSTCSILLGARWLFRSSMPPVHSVDELMAPFGRSGFVLCQHLCRLLTENLQRLTEPQDSGIAS